MTVLGLDISTSCTGYTVLDDAGDVVFMGHVDFKDCDTYWEKVDKARKSLDIVVQEFKPTDFFIEESLQGFRPGLSSANTLLTLAKFNGILSYHLRLAIGKDPIYISSGDARRACGVKLTTKKKHPRGLGHKEQTFNAITSGLLKDRTWPIKKTKKDIGEAATQAERVVDWAMDEVDSYVIGRAGWKRLNKAPAVK